jgi:hypothetical protein
VTPKLTCPPVVVGVIDAAAMLNCSEQRVRDLIRADLLATVPHLSTPSKIAIAVRELERFAAGGVTATRLGVAS